MKIENFIALRYILDIRKNKDIAAASIIVIIVIALSIVFFIASVSIMNGYIYGLMKIAFEVESSHVNMAGYHELYDSTMLLNSINEDQYVKDKISYINLYRETKVLLNANGKKSGIVHFRSVPENIFQKDKGLNDCIQLIDGKKSIGLNEIIISKKTAEKLRLKVNDILYLTAMIVETSPSITLQRLKVTGIFTTGYIELDERLAYVGSKTGENIFKDEIAYDISIKLKDHINVDEFAIMYNIPKKITSTMFNRYILERIDEINNNSFLGINVYKNIILKTYKYNKNTDNYEIISNLSKKKYLSSWQVLTRIGFVSDYNGMLTWKEKNYNMLTALKFEKNVIAFIVILVVFVAALSILSTLYITIHEKTKDISILKAVGFSPNNINNVFFLNGIYLGFAGVITGIIFGLLVMHWLNEILVLFSDFINGFQFIIYKLVSIFTEIDKPVSLKIFSKDFYLDKIYTDISFFEIVGIAFLTLLFSVFSSIIPAFKAGKIKPIEVIKDE